MNGNFERSGTYPLTVVPLSGFGHDNPSGEHVIKYVPGRDSFVKVLDDGTHDVVDHENATRFPDASTAAVKAGLIAARFRRAA